jgi:PhnB protein
MPVNYIPEGCQSVIPYFVVDDAAGLIRFLEATFGAVERERHPTPEGRIMHAEVKVGDCYIMMGDANEKFSAMPMNTYVYVEDVDATYRKGLEAGATSTMEPADQFYGDRSAGVKDRWGNTWWIGTHVEDVSPDEIQRRMEAMKQPR